MVEEVTNDTSTPETAETAIDSTKAPKTRRKKARRSVPSAHVHVLASFNNTIINITDPKGHVLTTASAGSSGFRGSKKGTAYAAQIAAEKAITGAKQAYGVTKVDVFVKGVGMGRDAAVRTLVNQNVDITSIRDVTPIAHGGVRPRRPKRT